MKHKLVIIASLAMMHLSFAQNEGELFTNVYVVPPTFLTTTPNESLHWQPKEDPFSAVRPPLPPRTAKKVLEDAGVTFGPGASAIYNPQTSQVIVRNTESQMELVEAYIDSVRTGVERQIYLTFREYVLESIPEEFEWLASLSDRAAAESDAPASRGYTPNSYEALRQELSRPPRRIAPRRDRSKAIGGVFTDPQAQIVFRRLKELAVEELSIPSVMCRSGQPAFSQVEERRYAAVPVLGADNHKLDIAFFLPPPGEPLLEEDEPLETPYKVTVWDGQTIAVSERAGGKIRVVFVTARIMDPAGMPIHPDGGHQARKPPEEPEVKLPEGPRPLEPEETERVKQADETALRGSQFLEDRKTMEAIAHFEKALERLPEHPITEPRRRAYQKQLNRAKKMRIADGWASPGTSGFHTVAKEETLFDIARRHGLSVDALKNANRLDGDSLKVGQILLIPEAIGENDQSAAKLAALLKNTILPEVEFSDARLDHCLGNLLRALLDNSDNGLFPDTHPKIVIDAPSEVAEIQITLRLSNVPAQEALRYVTSLASCRFRIEGETILVEKE